MKSKYPEFHHRCQIENRPSCNVVRPNVGVFLHGRRLERKLDGRESLPCFAAAEAMAQLCPSRLRLCQS
jgi:hypothetical protein